MNNPYRVISAMKLATALTACVLILLSTHNAFGVADLFLPEEVCASLGASDCSELTEKSTNAQYIDLNRDGTKELILTYGGGSCGLNYWVFKLDKKIKWVDIGGWCGCDDNVFKVKKTKHNGYFDIWSCGNSGFFDGKEYIQTRQ